MSAEVRDLNGRVVDSTKPGRNQEIAAFLGKLVSANDQGLIQAMSVVIHRTDDRVGARWCGDLSVAERLYSLEIIRHDLLSDTIIARDIEIDGDPLAGA